MPISSCTICIRPLKPNIVAIQISITILLLGIELQMQRCKANIALSLKPCQFFLEIIKEFYPDERGSSSFYGLLDVSSSGLQGDCDALNTAPTFAEKCGWPRLGPAETT